MRTREGECEKKKIIERCSSSGFLVQTWSLMRMVENIFQITHTKKKKIIKILLPIIDTI